MQQLRQGVLLLGPLDDLPEYRTHAVHGESDDRIGMLVGDVTVRPHLGPGELEVRALLGLAGPELGLKDPVELLQG